MSGGRVGVGAREMRKRCGDKSGSEWKLEWRGNWAGGHSADPPEPCQSNQLSEV